MRTGITSVLFVSVLAVVAAGCETFYDDNSEYDEAIAMVQSVKVDSTFNSTARISLMCYTPTPCWKFSRVTEERDSNQIRLTVFRKVQRYQTCIQVVSSFTHTMDIAVTSHGSYTIRIYRTPATTLDTTIVL